MDDEYLVVWDGFAQPDPNARWQMMNPESLRNFLIDRIRTDHVTADAPLDPKADAVAVSGWIWGACAIDNRLDGPKLIAHPSIVTNLLLTPWLPCALWQYSFPLNPKWILCDAGWWAVYKELLILEEKELTNSGYVPPNIGAAATMDAWLPRANGGPCLRQRIAAIREAHPQGFVPLPTQSPGMKPGRSRISHEQESGEGGYECRQL